MVGTVFEVVGIEHETSLAICDWSGRVGGRETDEALGVGLEEVWCGVVCDLRGGGVGAWLLRFVLRMRLCVCVLLSWSWRWWLFL